MEALGASESIEVSTTAPVGSLAYFLERMKAGR
jgi:hypothetical protein